MTIDEMRDRKKELGYTNQMISILSGVPIGTVSKVFAGITSSPRYDTIRALEQVLLPESVRVYEKAKKQEASEIPDDPDADALHNILSARLAAALMTCLDEACGPSGTLVMTAPFDVMIKPDTCVQPDIFVVYNDSLLSHNVFTGPPDLIIEVSAKSTIAEDLGEKQVLYRNSGVREYWVADTEKQILLAFCFENGYSYSIYSFDEAVPVMITGGTQCIDLSHIKKALKW